MELCGIPPVPLNQQVYASPNIQSHFYLQAKDRRTQKFSVYAIVEVDEILLVELTFFIFPSF